MKRWIFLLVLLVSAAMVAPAVYAVQYARCAQVKVQEYGSIYVIGPDEVEVRIYFERVPKCFDSRVLKIIINYVSYVPDQHRDVIWEGSGKAPIPALLRIHIAGFLTSRYHDGELLNAIVYFPHNRIFRVELFFLLPQWGLDNLLPGRPGTSAP